MRGLELILGEFRQLAGAEHGLVAHQDRRAYLAIAELARVDVEHELRQRPLESRERAVEHDEARAGELAGTAEIHQPEGFAQCRMILGGKAEARRRAVPADERVVRLVAPVRHLVGGQVGERRQRRVDLGLELVGARLERRLPVLAVGDPA